MADAPFDPGEFELAELTQKVQDVENVDDLEALLEAEAGGEDRENVLTVIESRIEAVSDDEAVGAIDPTEYTVAELGNRVQDVEEVDDLEAILEAEKAGDDRKTAKRLIDKRLDSVRGSEEDEEAEAEVVPPAEKHPDLDHPTADKQYVSDLSDGDYRDMWVYCETQAGDLLDVSKEMLGKARELMDGYNETYDADERVVAVLLGDDVGEHVEAVESYGADVVVYQEDPELARFRHKPYTELFCRMARAGGEAGEEEPAVASGDLSWKDYDEPRYVLFPATNNGRDLSAQVQAELDSGLASDCSGLFIEESVISNPAKTGESGSKKEFERVLHMKRPDFSGFEYSTILCLDSPTRDFHPQGASVIPGSFEIPEPNPEREGERVAFDLDIDDDWLRVEVVEHDRLEGGVDLSGNDVVVALGRGIGDDPTTGIELGLDLVEAFDDADLGLSRGVVTASYDFEGHVEQYVTEERQIGESGQVVEPDVYVAAGISGAIQHKVGMDDSETIIAINTDPDADIRDFSDYFVEGDLFEVLPALTEAVETGELRVSAAAEGGTSDD